MTKDIGTCLLVLYCEFINTAISDNYHILKVVRPYNLNLALLPNIRLYNGLFFNPCFYKSIVFIDCIFNI